MKTIVLAALAAIMVTGPVAAVEPVRACLPSELSAIVAVIQPRLPLVAPDGPEAPLGFYDRLACSLLVGGFTEAQIVAMPADELIDHAVVYLTQDRSRADALLAILQAMKQGKVTAPTPEPPARP